MIELGHIAITIAIFSAFMQAILPLLARINRHNNTSLRQFSPLLSVLQAGLFIFGFIMLAISFSRSDFSVTLVYQHSHTLKPMLYKITALWANHEGSLLLWLTVMAIFGACLAIFGAKKDENFTVLFIIGARRRHLFIRDFYDTHL